MFGATFACAGSAIALRCESGSTFMTGVKSAISGVCESSAGPARSRPNESVDVLAIGGMM